MYIKIDFNAKQLQAYAHNVGNDLSLEACEVLLDDLGQNTYFDEKFFRDYVTEVNVDELLEWFEMDDTDVEIIAEDKLEKILGEEDVASLSNGNYLIFN